MRTKKIQKMSLSDQAAELVDQVTPHVEAARERIVNDYLPAAQSALADARETAREVAQEARDRAQEAAVQAEKSTRKSRKKAAKRARELAENAVTAAPDNVPLIEKAREKAGPKPHRKRKFLVLLGIAGLGALAAKRLRGGTAAPSYAPPRPAPAPRPAPVATEPTSSTPPAPPDVHFEPDPATSTEPLADATAESLEASSDAGGAFLDEAIADADEQPHEVTTPDEPAEVEDVAEASRSKRR